MELIENRINESIKTKQKILNNKILLQQIKTAVDMISKTLMQNGKVLFCGNGGSASDALHLAGEFVGHFQKERKALPAISLNGDVVTLTSIANDYGYNDTFSRIIEGLMKKEDVFVGISTSGNSENVYQGMLMAKEIGGKTIALLGKDGGKIKDIVDIAIIVPSDCTARIQEAHIMIGHIICELVEEC